MARDVGLDRIWNGWVDTSRSTMVIHHLLLFAALISLRTEHATGDVLDVADDQSLTLQIVVVSIVRGGSGA
jgi:hypothetical protein